MMAFSDEWSEEKTNEEEEDDNTQRNKPDNQSMATFKTKYANMSISSDDMQQQKQEERQQSTPCQFTELSSKISQFKAEAKLVKAFNSPIKAGKSNRCRRSNTTFTMANGARKNKIIDYFNNLEMGKPLLRASCHYIPSTACNTQTTTPALLNESKQSVKNTNNEKINEKIQDLFFHDDSYIQQCAPPPIISTTTPTLNEVLSTFLDSPVSVGSKQDQATTDHHLVATLCDTNTSNSAEKIRRSFSMPGMCMLNTNQVNASIYNALANNSELHMLSLSSPSTKKSLYFNEPQPQLNLDEKSIDNLSIENASHDSNLTACNNSSFIREPNRLSKNIKRMFKNVVRLQMSALNNLEKFYEAQLVKVEADRQQNLKLNPSNSHRINEFFDRQLELLEERVQVNLENISKEKQRKLSTTSLRFEAPHRPEEGEEEDDESVIQINADQQQKEKVLFSQKLAQIISQNNAKVGCKRSQSKIFLELKNNLINQNTLLPSKLADYSPKANEHIGFKRNLSLPFKQCKQNFKRMRNETSSTVITTQVITDQVVQNIAVIDNHLVKKTHEVSNLAKIVKLNGNYGNRNFSKSTFEISANSAFKPVKRIVHTNTFNEKFVDNFEPANFDADFIKHNKNLMRRSKILKPMPIDHRRNSSILFDDDQKCFHGVVVAPRLSDSHLMFKLRKERKLAAGNEETQASIQPVSRVSTYQKQHQNVLKKSDAEINKLNNLKLSRQSSKNSFIETEV